jgi:hypothetical protein
MRTPTKAGRLVIGLIAGVVLWADGTALAQSAQGSGLEVSAVIKAGLESDSNPHRLSGEESDSDLVERFFLELSALGRAPRQVVMGTVRVGAKRFHDFSEEDALVVDVSGLARRHLSGPLGWIVGLSARNRLERGHVRDYLRASARTGPIFDFGVADLLLTPSAGYFLYRPDTDLSYFSVGGTARLGLRFVEALELGLSYTFADRDYREAVVVNEVTGLRLAEGDARQDDGHTLGLAVSFESSFVASLEVFWQRNVSNSFGKAYSRLVGRLSGAFALPLDLYFNLQLSAQRTTFEDAVLIDPTLAIDEDNRNAVVIAISQDIVDDWLRWEARYSLYLQAFGGDVPDYDRHLFFGGVAASLGN